jgi:F-type H+-transporting ATPase subunit b
MSELFSKLGIDWKLLIAQAVNFLLLLTILRFTVYKPLLNLLRDRREKIEKGLKDAELSGKRLEEAELMKKNKLAEADRTSIAMLKETEVKAKQLESSLLLLAKEKEASILSRAEKEAQNYTEEEKKRFFEEAGALIKQGLSYVVQSSPESIDEKLIQEAVAKMSTAGMEKTA